MQLGKAAYFVAGAFVGGSVTYLITREALKKRYLDMAEEEIRSVKETYDMLRGEDVKPGSEEDKARTHAYLRKLDQLQYSAQSEDPETIVITEEYIEEVQEEQFDAQREETEDVRSWPRSQDAPYVIATEEYMNDAEEYSKLTLTYFEEDNTLVDETDEIIPDVEGVIGEANLLNFGAGSTDKNTLYIRNDKHETDYEVIRNESSYSSVILGIEEWHADDVRPPKKVRKMRDGS